MRELMSNDIVEFSLIFLLVPIASAKTVLILNANSIEDFAFYSTRTSSVLAP